MMTRVFLETAAIGVGLAVLRRVHLLQAIFAHIEERVTMNAQTTAMGDGNPFSDPLKELPESSASGVGIRLNGQVVIYSLAIGLALVTASECQSITHWPSLLYGAVLWGWWGVIASTVWKFGARVSFLSSFSPTAIAMHAFVGSALGVLHLLLLASPLAGWPIDQVVWTRLLNLNRFGLELLIYGFVLGITGIVQFQIRAQRAALKSLELQRQLSAAHLRALQMQLEPHFLFNTLNAITTLVELGRQRQAVDMLSHLNAILKSTLVQETPQKISLAQELVVIENYLAIEQIRFADRLHIELAIDPRALDGLIPCFLLQPIVENAIRHGISQIEENGVIRASVRRQGDQLHLSVKDNGPGLQSKPENVGHGIGLRNTEDRLAHFYPRNYQFTSRSIESGGYEVAITIPYEQALA
jgi:sensor histidine kinase YesM